MKTQRILVALALIAALVCTVSANGFRNPEDGAKALSMAGGKTVWVDDASAAWHNPANLARIEHSQIQVSTTWVYGETTFTAPSGLETTTEDAGEVYLPGAFVAMPLEPGKLALSVALNSPYGQSTRWPEDEVFRYTAPTYVKMVTTSVNPSLVMALNNRLSVAVGVAMLGGSIEFEQYMPWSMVLGTAGVPDGRAEFEADGTGYGGNAAIRWDMSESQHLAATYRSGIDVEMTGDYNVDVLPSAPQLASFSNHSTFRTEFAYPSVVGAGYGARVGNDLKLGVDVEWVEFSRYENLPLDVAQNNPLLPATELRQDWNDSWTFGISGEWDMNQAWAVRAGYKFMESPIPDETFSPTLPTGDQHVLTTGLGYNAGHHAIDAALAVSLNEERTISSNDNPAYNGTYDVETSYIVSLSYQYSF